MPRTPIAQVLSGVLGDLPISIRAYDGSAAGVAESGAVAVVDIVRPEALNYLATSGGELGLGRAYVSGALELSRPGGGLVSHYDMLKLVAGDAFGKVTWQHKLHVLRDLGVGVLRPVAPPAQEVRAGVLWGLRHSLTRDARVISHHYDVSNRFYEWVLGPSMAYTCAVYPTADAGLDEAQEEKFDLVCRKLDLQPGQRLLDVGCGWGRLTRHAAKYYGVQALGVTLSRQQAEWAQKSLADEGLTDLAEVRFADYRSVTETDFDAVASIGLTEHIGVKNLPDYFSFLGGKLKPQGKLLNHCITRPDGHDSAKHRGGFIDRYVFPDGELEPVGQLASAVADHGGLEVRHEENLREHYARTCKAWCDNLDAHWDEAVAEVGLGTAKVWALYLAGSAIGFEQRRIELHQILATKTVDGDAGVPLRPDFTRRRPPMTAGDL
jgi:cyclopropane-fatty-acyl-phospholipid synthase